MRRPIQMKRSNMLYKSTLVALMSFLCADQAALDPAANKWPAPPAAATTNGMEPPARATCWMVDCANR